MKIIDIDYYANFGNSGLHKLSAKIKLLGLLFILIIILLSGNYILPACIYGILLLALVTQQLPRKQIFFSSLYPLIFLILIFFSIDNLTIGTFLLLTLRVLSITTYILLVVYTTNFLSLFKELSFVFPSVITNIIFLTYRSIFILAKNLDSILTALKIRGLPEKNKYKESINTISNLVGLFIVNSIDSSERMYEAMNLRGYTGNFEFLRKKDGKNS